MNTSRQAAKLAKKKLKNCGLNKLGVFAPLREILGVF